VRRGARLLVALAAFALPAAASAQQAAPAMPSLPSVLELATPSVPMAVRQEDADAFLRSLGAPPPPPPPAGPAPKVTIQLDPPLPENPTNRFVFEDVTDRPAVRARTLAERRVAVELFRQSLAPRVGR
jgi:hypothetical protein